MKSELMTQLADLLERWDTLSAAAVEKMEMAQRPEQGGFYAGVLFGMDVARDELAAALARSMVESSKSPADVMKAAGQPPN